jgi:hypothetical protein
VKGSAVLGAFQRRWGSVSLHLWFIEPDRRLSIMILLRNGSTSETDRSRLDTDRRCFTRSYTTVNFQRALSIQLMATSMQIHCRIRPLRTSLVLPLPKRATQREPASMWPTDPASQLARVHWLGLLRWEFAAVSQLILLRRSAGCIHFSYSIGCLLVLDQRLSVSAELRLTFWIENKISYNILKNDKNLCNCWREFKSLL